MLNFDGERRQVEGYTSDLLTDYAIDWLEEGRDEDKTFLCIPLPQSRSCRILPGRATRRPLRRQRTDQAGVHEKHRAKLRGQTQLGPRTTL